METQKPKQTAPAPAAATPAKPAEPGKTEARSDERGHRRRMVGVITSDKMDKTVVVVVTRRIRDTKFGKYLVKKAKYKAHSEKNAVHVGDKVQIIESRPLSKEKRWRVERLLEKARRTTTSAPAAQA
jgi:small subunit ribosomal protein S17